MLTPLVSESAIIAEAAAKRPELSTGATQGEWYTRRVKTQKITNRKGPETWAQGKGTEYKVV